MSSAGLGVRRWVAVASLGLLLSNSAAVAADDGSRAQLLLTLLSGIEREYREGFDAQGNVVRPFELDEAAALAREAQALAKQLNDSGHKGIEPTTAALADLVTRRVAPEILAAQSQRARASVQSATGAAIEMFPTQAPQAVLGKPLYDENCARCHGAAGEGDGVDSSDLTPHPPDFTNNDFMRRETPADFFVVISLGRRSSAMPAWQDSLSVQQRWDIVSYLWTLRNDESTRTAVIERFVRHCAACHAASMATGERSSTTSPWNLQRDAERSDAEIFEAIGEIDQPQHRVAASMSDAERWELVSLVRQFTLGSNASLTATSPEQRLSAAVSRVAAEVRQAVDAYRQREPEAPSLAAAAYLSFEPLESEIASHNREAVRLVEKRFAELQLVLSRSDVQAEVDSAAKRLELALQAATAPTASGWQVGQVTEWVLLAAGIVGAALLGWRRYAATQRD